MLSRFLLATSLLALWVFSTAQTTAAEELTEARDRRMSWWREAKFGMFIHWGLYAIPAGYWNGKPVDNAAGEWIMYGAQILPADYEPLVKEFNPVKFDADEWVSIAKDAGMRYITITTKHHDGFALFDSQYSEYDVMATPFQRDIMKEMALASRTHGLQICWYHSILDWHHYDYLPRGEGSQRPWDTRPTAGADLDRYILYMKGQLKELLVNYGPIGVLWFDGGWEHTPEELRANEVVAMIRGLQPDIIINNRIRIPQDFDTPEQKIPETGIPGRDWETCMTMNGTWGFKQQDTNWKSTATLIRNLIDIVSKGGNFLLNVGPKADGTIPEESVTRLKEMGRWMKVNGESIYGTTASVFPHLGWGRCTVKPGRLYLHVFEWPEDGKLRVPGLMSAVKSARLLADPSQAALGVEQSENGWTVTVGPQMPDLIATVVVLEIEGEPEVAAPEVVELFNGVDLSGWTVYTAAESADTSTWWTASDGVLRTSGSPAGYIRTTAAYENYRLKFEYRYVNEAGNGGVLVHVQEPDMVWPKSIEGQLMHENAADFYVIEGSDFKEHVNKDDRRVQKQHRHNEKPLGEWNSFEAVCDGDTIALIVNGLRQNHATETNISKGYIAFQSEGVPMEFRNIRLEMIRK